MEKGEIPEFPKKNRGLSYFNGAADRTRTYDPIITNDVLYHLSYSGQSPTLNNSARDWRAH